MASGLKILNSSANQKIATLKWWVNIQWLICLRRNSLIKRVNTYIMFCNYIYVICEYLNRRFCSSFPFAHYIFLSFSQSLQQMLLIHSSIFSYTSFVTKNILFTPWQEKSVYCHSFLIHCYSKLFRIILNTAMCKTAEKYSKRLMISKFEYSQSSFKLNNCFTTKH